MKLIWLIIATMIFSNEKNNSEVIDDESFWKIISSYELVNNGEEKYLENLTVELSKLSYNEIVAFELKFREKLNALSSWNTYGTFIIYQGLPTDDSFLGYRCWIISQGKDFFSHHLNNPDKYYLEINDRIDKIKLPFLEELIHVTDDAYEIASKNGKNFPSIPPSEFVTDEFDILYDMASVNLKGIPVKSEEELESRFPNLYKILSPYSKKKKN